MVPLSLRQPKWCGRMAGRREISPGKGNTYLPGPAIEKRISAHISRKKTLRLICISAPEHKGARKQASPTDCVFLLFGDVIGVHTLGHSLSSAPGVGAGKGVQGQRTGPGTASLPPLACSSVLAAMFLGEGRKQIHPVHSIPTHQREKQTLCKQYKWNGCFALLLISLSAKPTCTSDP